MSAETVLYSTLTADGTVSGLVGTRISPWPVREQQTLPYISYRIAATDWSSTLPGTGDGERELVEINCHATTYAGARALRNAVVSALEGTGYPQDASPYYDSNTQIHTFSVDWSFLT